MPRKFLLVIGAFLLLAGAVLVLGHAAWAGEPLSGDLTLSRAVALALEKNPLVGDAAAKTAQAQAELDEAKSGFGPKIDAGLGATWLKEARETLGTGTVLTGPGAGGSVLSRVPLGYEDTYQAALTLTQVLYSGGTLTANRKAAELNLASVQAQETRTRQSVIYSVQSAFYSLQRARAKLKVALENLSLTRAHLKQVEAFYRAGVVAKNEVLRVQVSVSQAEQERIKAENAIQVGFAALQRAVGVPLPGVAQDVRMEPPTLDMPGDPAALALANRSELTSLNRSREAALQLAEASAGQARPQVALQGQLSTTDDEFPPTEGAEWSVNLGVQWRLYDHGEVKSQIAQAQAQALQLLHRYDDMKNQILQEVAVASSDLASATARIAVGKDQVIQAQEDYRMALKRYEAQVGTNIDVIDARVYLIAALNALADAIYDAATAEAGLVYVVGAGSIRED